MPLSGFDLAMSSVRRTRVIVREKVKGKGLRLDVEDAGQALLQDHIVLEMRRFAALLDPTITIDEVAPPSFEDISRAVGVLQEGILQYGAQELMEKLYLKLLDLKSGATVLCYTKDLKELLPTTMAKVC